MPDNDRDQRVVLIVDDTPANIDVLVGLLREDHKLRVAPNGPKALQLARLEPKPDLILLDIMMPEMDGYEVCRRLKADPDTQPIPVIFITAKSGIDDEQFGFELGAVDYITKPFNPALVQARARAHLKLYRQQRELTEAYQALELNAQRIRRDLEAATRLQRQLLPQTPRTGLPLELAWLFQPAEELAGDLFNVFALDQDRLGFYLLDVSGHGIPAAMFSVYLSRLISPSAMSPSTGADPGDCLDPARLVGRINASFQAQDGNTAYCTMIYGVIDARTGQGRLCQAGHPYPLICRREGTVESIGLGGFPVGLVEDADYDEVGFQLRPGDLLVLYSDGVTECAGPDGELFGTERLGEAFRRRQGQGLAEALRGVEEQLLSWHQGQGGPSSEADFRDDVSLLALRLAPE